MKPSHTAAMILHASLRFLVVVVYWSPNNADGDDFRPTTIALSATIASPLPTGPIPISVEVDFAAAVRDAACAGVIDPNTVEVRSAATGELRPHRLSPHIAYEDRARVQWLATTTDDPRFEIRFQTAAKRPVLRPRAETPLIGLGDLLRYTGPTPRPIGGSLATRLVDLNADGALDLVTADYYTTEPLWPERIPNSWSPFLCYRGLSATGAPADAAVDDMLFGDGVRLRYRDRPEAADQFFIGGYMHCDIADVNGDKLPDLAFAAAEKSSEESRIPNVADYIHIFTNTGRLDAGGMPIFTYADRVKHPKGNWGPVRIVDLDADGAIDFVVGSLFSETNPRAFFIRNTNPAGWPIRAAEGVAFEPGPMASFLDVDADGVLDSVCVASDQRWNHRNFCSRVVWRKGLKGEPTRFGPPQTFDDIDDELCEFVSTVDSGGGRGVLVSAGYIGERIAFYELLPTVAGGNPRFRRRALEAVQAPVRGGDQPTPFICDWNDDGRWDLLYGGGFGWIRVFVNEGTNERPNLMPGIHALSEGKPINLHMTQFFPGIEKYWHDLGYVHPAFVDWDGDGLRDLMAANVSNRIFWFRNIGTRTAPTFGPQLEVICDGYEESEERTATTAKLLGADTKLWKITPDDPSGSPFWWRARAGFGDLNGDGLTDLVTADADTHSAPNSNYVESLSVFLRYRDEQGNLRLRRDHVVELPDGSRSINIRYQPSQTIIYDWDRDGLLDLIINHGRTMDSAPAVLRNIGTPTVPKFDHPRRLTCYGEELSGIAKHGPYYGVGDMDGDGKADLIASTEVGTYVFFRRTAMDMARQPTTVLSAPRVVRAE